MKAGLRVISVILLLLLGAGAYSPAFALGKVSGFVERGGASVLQNINGTTIRAQRSYPNSTVTVYLTGTVTLASLYADSVGTVKANPFQAGTDGSWYFYAADGCYDVRFSGTGIAAPWTESSHCTGLTGSILRSGGSQPLSADLDLGGLYTVTSRNSMPVINLNALGMVGDDAFDNTAILTAALASVPATGAVLVIGPGDYRATGPFLVKKYTSILGAGKYSTRFLSPTTDQNFFYCNTYPDSVGIIIRSMTISSTNAYVQTAGSGIRLDGGGAAAVFSIADVQVTGFWNGIYVTTGITSSMTNVTTFACRNWGFIFEGTCTSLTLNAVWATTCGRLMTDPSPPATVRDSGGFWFKGINSVSPGMRYSTINSPAADGNNGVAYRADYVQDMTMVSPGAESASIANGGSDAIYLNHCGAVTITSPRLQRGDHGINVKDSVGPIIIGGRVWESGGNGINVDASSAVTIINPSVEYPVGDFISVAGGSTNVNLVSPIYEGALAVIGATNTTPIEITTGVPHNWATGGTKVIVNATGNTAANGTWVITKTGANTFTLDGSVGNGAYTGAGVVKSRELVDAGVVVSSITNGVVSSASGFAERARTSKVGEWVYPDMWNNTASFDAANFTTSSGGGVAWTVDAADVTHVGYTLVGKTMTVNFVIAGTNVTLAPVTLEIKIPAGKTCVKSAFGTFLFVDAGLPAFGWSIGCVVVGAGSTYIQLWILPAGNWTATAGNNTKVYGQIAFEIG